MVSIQERDRICLQQKTAEKRLTEARAVLKGVEKTKKNQIEQAKANLKILTWPGENLTNLPVNVVIDTSATSQKAQNMTGIDN